MKQTNIDFLSDEIIDEVIEHINKETVESDDLVIFIQSRITRLKEKGIVDRHDSDCIFETVCDFFRDHGFLTEDE